MRGKGCGVRKAMGRGKGIDREREGKSNQRQRVWSKEGEGRGKGIDREREGKSNDQRLWSKDLSLPFSVARGRG